jgi:hypothetical protein
MMMARSKLVLTVLGTAAALAVAGCGSVAAPAASDAGNASAASGSAASGNAGAASGHASASASPGGSSASPGRVNGTGGPLGGVSGLLCSAPGAVSQVIVTRTGFGGPVLPSGPRVSAFLTSARPPSPGLVVRGAAQASALAKAVCGLPAMSGGLLHCPQQTTASYRLTFTSGGRLLPAVIVRPSGCETVTGAGSPRTVARDSALLKMLASMVGPLPLPGAVHLPGTAVSGGPLHPIAARA